MTDPTQKQFDYLADSIGRLEDSMIDPRAFGRLEAEVQSLQDEVADLRADVKTLLELANKSKGGFWMGMAIASGVGGVVTFIADKVLMR
jgi:hypothetical protein